jgi:hypothetical protein
MRFRPVLTGLFLFTFSFTPLIRAEQTGPPPREVNPSVEVPYRLTNTKHVLVRVKLNDKGPFNFIIDTGAPALIMTEAVAKKAGGRTEGGWSYFDKLELEGGLKIPKARGVAMDMFQLKGMNSMGLAGVELHGVIGFNVLSQFRIEYDFTQPKLVWTPVNFEVPPPKRLMGNKKGAPGSLDMIGELIQMMAAFSGVKANYAVVPRGFLGAELETKDKELLVKSVVAGGPAEKAGLLKGDLIQTAKGKAVANPDEMMAAVQKLPEGSSLKLHIKRGSEEKEITVALGKGF